MTVLKYVSCELDVIIQRIEWITLMFFAAMFITMECLARLGLIKWIGKQTEQLILMVDKDYRLTLAILIVLWVSLLTNFIFISLKMFAINIIQSFIINVRFQR